MEKYDLIIVGAGPAGIFTAVELLRHGSKKKILLVEKGKPVEKRHCPKAELGHCVNCRPTCAITTGFSGAGAFSDGKLSLSYEVGGDLPTLIGEEFAQELIDYTDKIYLEFGADPHVEGIYTGEEIKLLIDESTESGLIDPEQNEFVDNIFDLGDKDAEGIMTPRTDVICLDLEDTLEENWDVVRQYKYTRYPVCDGSKDRIVGFVHTKDLVDEPKDAPMSDWKIRELPPVPEGAPIAKLLQAMQEGRTEMCVVVDEHGGTAGIVTMSDIMEQIVGRIDDEYVHDTDDDIEELPDGTYQINGTLAIDDLVELLGFEPEEANDVETAGGLLLSLFDRIPKEGDVAVLEDRGTKVTFTVLAMDRLRIDRILVVIDKPAAEEE